MNGIDLMETPCAPWAKTIVAVDMKPLIAKRASELHAHGFQIPMRKTGFVGLAE